MNEISDSLWRVVERQLGQPLPQRAASLSALPEEAVIRVVEVVAAIGRAHNLVAASVAADVARRSAPELGVTSLAKRSGARDAVDLLSGITGASRRESGDHIAVGTVMAAEDPSAESLDLLGRTCPGGTPCGCDVDWQSIVSRYVAAGRLGTANAAAILRGIGRPTRDVSAHELALSLRALLEPFQRDGSLTPDQFAREARYRREGLDRRLILSRERRNTARRSITIGPEDDGMHRISGLLTAEVAGTLRTLCDGAVAQNLRTPRFTETPSPAEVDAIATVPQLWHDALAAALRIAVTSDKNALPRQGAPVAVIIRETELHPADTSGRLLAPDAVGHLDRATADSADDGLGTLPATGAVVSAALTRTLACSDGVAPITMNAQGVVLNLGRTQRLFSRHQRLALTVRDGGCRWNRCDRPPSWCDAHHIDEWHNDNGRTDLADGILLCRTHHLLLHNQHWRITRDRYRYFLERPREVDPTMRRIELRTRNPVHAAIPGRRRTG